MARRHSAYPGSFAISSATAGDVNPKNCGPLTAARFLVRARSFTARITCCHACVGEGPTKRTVGSSQSDTRTATRAPFDPTAALDLTAAPAPTPPVPTPPPLTGAREPAVMRGRSTSTTLSYHTLASGSRTLPYSRRETNPTGRTYKLDDDARAERTGSMRPSARITTEPTRKGSARGGAADASDAAAAAAAAVALSLSRGARARFDPRDGDGTAARAGAGEGVAAGGTPWHSRRVAASFSSSFTSSRASWTSSSSPTPSTPRKNASASASGENRSGDRSRLRHNAPSGKRNARGFPAAAAAEASRATASAVSETSTEMFPS